MHCLLQSSLSLGISRSRGRGCDIYVPGCGGVMKFISWNKEIVTPGGLRKCKSLSDAAVILLASAIFPGQGFLPPFFL